MKKFMDNLLIELNTFLEKASFSGYAGDGRRVAAQRAGHKEYEYKDGPWVYRDSYAGYARSYGQELVWYDNRPFWTCSYGGGMEPGYTSKTEFIEETYNFLKKALSRKSDIDEFQPRGPKKIKAGKFVYTCKWHGSIREFEGFERITFKGKTIYTQQFFGGLIISS